MREDIAQLSTYSELAETSIRVIRAGQQDTGAYLASSTFPTYRYSWFRDGAFIAYAMDLMGEHESARRFHDWAARSILSRESEVNAVLDELRSSGAVPDPGDPRLLNTRYRADGSPGSKPWENFQLDGFGTWIWAVERHFSHSSTLSHDRSGRQTRARDGGPREPIPQTMRRAVGLVARYLSQLWQVPCYDLWEEHRDQVHTYTLAGIYSGLISAGTIGIPELQGAAESIREYVGSQLVTGGRLRKSTGYDGVDCALVAAAVPYGLIPLTDPVMHATVASIEEDLVTADGAHRYRDDTYYGGGSWILLSAWLGWYYAQLGDDRSRRRAFDLLRWVALQADKNGLLPEQVTEHLLAPDYLETWVKRWGRSARPLLWSHAMYLILWDQLGRPVE